MFIVSLPHRISRLQSRIEKSRSEQSVATFQSWMMIGSVRKKNCELKTQIKLLSQTMNRLFHITKNNRSDHTATTTTSLLQSSDTAKRI
jgi:hypothetical protein